MSTFADLPRRDWAGTGSTRGATRARTGTRWWRLIRQPTTMPWTSMTTPTLSSRRWTAGSRPQCLGHYGGFTALLVRPAAHPGAQSVAAMILSAQAS